MKLKIKENIQGWFCCTTIKLGIDRKLGSFIQKEKCLRMHPLTTTTQIYIFKLKQMEKKKKKKRKLKEMLKLNLENKEILNLDVIFLRN